MLLAYACSAGAATPLPSWRPGPVREAILSFVDTTTRAGSPRFVPAEERIATFDNDGTLWAEQPAYFQLLFVLDRIRALAPQHPEWRERDPYRAALAGDLHALAALGEGGVSELLAATHAGMSTDAFAASVRDWLATARHPQTGRAYTKMVYQPMRELLDLLRAHGYRTYLVSGGGQDFMRAWAEAAYGIPPEQVIGSYGALRYEVRDGVPVLTKLAQVELVDDHAGKPVGIQRFIGRRPVIAFGNSDGDLEMLEWTSAGPGPHLAGLVHHTDAVREWAYDRSSPIGRLDAALDAAQAHGWIVIDMARDWRRIYPEAPPAASSPAH